MDELEEILQRLGDAESAIESFVQRQRYRQDTLPPRAGALFPELER